MREGLRSIVSGTEQAPPNDEVENVAKVAAHREQALALTAVTCGDGWNSRREVLSNTRDDR